MGGIENMNEARSMKAKLGLNVFKPGRERHIVIKPGKEKDPRLKAAVAICPAGLYSLNPQGQVELDIDGCLECGTCRIACGTEVLDWHYPDGETGIQYLFG
jgi:ferredoxin like protein